jgi:tetratricopeptide (TPR) repeat protein
MEKVLKKYTTIPEHLYVERQADIQLRNIIKEMQRPGYVLVARQMGKTNLLFNAKRTLENKDRLFVYVDLSNLYENERDCYRNIINNIIEPNIDLFESIEGEIEKIRIKNLPPHNEYSRSLRTVLNFFKGDLVIILDEIDALKSINYSDNIFAQIRSNYFSRTNFPVFERLTYVLSGVIEPTELIKDRNKSPFNIGDKIYLDDFTIEEHKIFIKKSKLDINDIISDEIFNWTNGNPRLTFDICSEVEDEIINNGICEIEQLNEIIKKKYLNSFDIAPIDHIRELVKTNKSIRKSILSIHKNDTLNLSDDIKRKLYLYGIINSNFDEKTKIKNKIIELSLTEEWLKSIDKDKEVSFVYGVAKYSSKEYIDAIEILENVLEDITSSKNDVEASNYFIGLSYFKLQNYEKASVYFEKKFQSESYSSDAKSFLGICKIANGEKETGISILQDSIKNETNNFAYHNAILNLAINIEDIDLSYNLLNKLYDSTLIAKSDEESELDQLKTLSLYYQSDILLRKNDAEGALTKIRSALEYSSPSESLFLYYLIYNISEIKDNSLKDKLLKTIIENNLLLETQNLTPISFNEISIIRYLDFLFDEITLFENLLNYTIENLLTNSNKFELVYRMINIATSNRENLLKYLEGITENYNSSLIINVYKQFAYNNANDTEKYNKYFDKFLNNFKEIKLINSDDIYLFALAIKFKSDSNKIREALKLCQIIEKRITNIDNEDLKFESVIIYYWFTNLYFSISDKINSLKYAEISLNIIDNSKRKKTSMIDEEGIKTIKEQLLDIIKQITYTIQTIKPFVSSKKYGRNDIVEVKYKNGTIVKKKHKQIEADLIAGRCEIL